MVWSVLLYLAGGWRILVCMRSGQWRLGQRPGLDGLRGIAVLLVVATHALVPVADGAGAAGVTVFFTLSGFLITTLLLDDIETRGRIRFARFYARRALRLLPALVALVGFVLLLGRLVPGATQRDSVLGAVFYASNWVMMDPVPFLRDWLFHTWSLSIEEQFYLLWPIMLLGLVRLGPRPMIAATAVLAATSTVVRFALWDPANELRVYFGIDARADALLIGALVAMVLRRRLEEASRPWLVAAGLLVVLAVAPWGGWARYVLMPTLVAVATAGILFGAAQGSGVRALEWKPLLWVGRRSYGLYLWHYPVATVMQFEIPLPWWQELPITLAVSLGLTALSWRYVEEPFLRLKDRSRERRRVEQRPGLEVAEVDRRAVGVEADL